MPYRIHWEGHGVYERFFGELTFHDYEASHREVTRDIRAETVRYVLVDCLEAQPGPAVTPEVTEAYAKLERVEYLDSPDIVYAVVAVDERLRDQALYFRSLLRLLHPVAVFSTVEDARAWIASNPRGRGGS